MNIAYNYCGYLIILRYILEQSHEEGQELPSVPTTEPVSEGELTDILSIPVCRLLLHVAEEAGKLDAQQGRERIPIAA